MEFFWFALATLEWLWAFVVSPQAANLGSLLSGVFTFAAVVVATAGAFVGFNRWKRELHWKAQYDAAQRVLGEAYRVREVFRDVRMSQEEAWLAARAATEGREIASAKQTALARDDYYRRLAQLERARNDLIAAEAQAFAACEPGVRELLKDFYAQVRQLPKSAYMFWYDAMHVARMRDRAKTAMGAPNPQYVEQAEAKVRTWQTTVYQHGDDETDRKLVQALSGLEQWAQQYKIREGR